ncbi:MAG: cyanoexosortase A system-associated protein [Cyanobacteria bacterium P01_A01_bin.84]
MISASKIRIFLLALTCGAVFLTLGNVVVRSPNYKQTIKPVSFPERVSLPHWKQLDTTKELQSSISTEVISQKKYQYVQKDRTLDIEMRYLKEINVRSLIKRYQNIETPAKIRQKPGIGYYGVGFDKGRAYLSACITPQGNGTYTYEQFKENQDKYFLNLDPQHLLSWILGEKRFKEERCLWTHLSIPAQKYSLETAYQTLEKAWFPWYRYWQSKLP